MATIHSHVDVRISGDVRVCSVTGKESFTDRLTWSEYLTLAHSFLTDVLSHLPVWTCGDNRVRSVTVEDAFTDRLTLMALTLS